MELDEARRVRADTERQLLRALLEFERETRCAVRAVLIRRADVSSLDSTRTETKLVKVDVEVGL